MEFTYFYNNVFFYLVSEWIEKSTIIIPFLNFTFIRFTYNNLIKQSLTQQSRVVVTLN